LLSEGARITDAADLLESDADLVRKAHTIGLRQFAVNLAAGTAHRASAIAAGFGGVISRVVPE